MDSCRTAQMIKKVPDETSGTLDPFDPNWLRSRNKRSVRKDPLYYMEFTCFYAIGLLLLPMLFPKLRFLVIYG